MTIYKPCGIRGNATSELTPDLYRRWGYTLGHWVGPGGKFCVGGDVRDSTPVLLAALIDGLCLSGVDLIDLGQMPTPMVYYAKRRLQAAGCAIVTASHHGATQNGLAWMVGNRPPTEKQVAQLESASQRTDGTSLDENGSSPRSLDISFDYVAWLQETWCDALRAHHHIVLDPMHGAWSGRARRYLHAIFPECLISVVHGQCDGQFGGRAPDCSEHENLGELCEAVDRQRAHLGIAWDGDGDRVTLVDGHGVPLSAEETTWILLQSFGPDLQGQPLLYDVRFSDRLPEAAQRLGARPAVEKSHHACFHARMLETGAIFGAQVNGHYFYRELEGGDDGLYTACRVIAHMTQSGKSLDELREHCPKVFVTPDLRLPLETSAHQEVFEQIHTAWATFPQSTLDGIRVDLPGGWALARSSSGEPAVTFRFESCDWPGLDELVRQFCAALPGHGEALWNCYEMAMGVEGRT